MPYPGLAKSTKAKSRRDTHHTPTHHHSPIELTSLEIPKSDHAHSPSRKPTETAQQGPKNKEVIDELRELAARAERLDLNLPVIIAKLVILLGIFLLQWASQISKKRRSMAILKVLAVLAFSALYPWFSLIVILAAATIYILSNPKSRL